MPAKCDTLPRENITRDEVRSLWFWNKLIQTTSGDTPIRDAFNMHPDEYEHTGIYKCVNCELPTMFDNGATDSKVCDKCAVEIASNVLGEQPFNWILIDKEDTEALKRAHKQLTALVEARCKEIEAGPLVQPEYAGILRDY